MVNLISSTQYPSHSPLKISKLHHSAQERGFCLSVTQDFRQNAIQPLTLYLSTSQLERLAEALMDSWLPGTGVKDSLPPHWIPQHCAHQ